MTWRQRQTITDQIAVDDSGVRFVDVEGIAVGDHLLVHKWRGMWSVTHRPTGLYIQRLFTGQEAYRLAERLDRAGIELGDRYDERAIRELIGHAERERWAEIEEVG